MIWNEHYECMEREELLKLQGQRVKEMEIGRASCRERVFRAV